MKPAKAYLGDGVYIQWDDLDRVVLTTENGISVTNTIVLESEVAQAMAEWTEAQHRAMLEEATAKLSRHLSET